MVVYAGNIIRAADVNNADRVLWATLSGDSSTNASSTLIDTTGLSITLLANTTYYVDSWLNFIAPAANDGLFGITQPSGCTTITQPLAPVLAAASDDATPRLGVGTISATSGALISAGGLGATVMAVRIKGRIVNGATAGVWQMQHGVNTVSGGGVCQVKAGSFVLALRQG